MEPLLVLAAYVAGVSLVDFAAAGIDKAKAARGTRRIRERTLLGLAALGGSPGLLLGMVLFRHKTRKASFLAWFGLILVAQGLAAWLLLR